MNEIDYIGNLLNSVLDQDYPNEYTEIIVVDGMSNDGTNEYLKNLKINNLLILENEARYVSNAMNIGIKNCIGDIIIRMDVHSTYPRNYISTLVNHLIDFPEIGNVGVPCKTLPANNSRVSRAISFALSSPLGVGNSYFRTTIPLNYKSVDTVPFGCWRKEIFQKVGLFDEELIRNQDDELNQRIIKAGMKIHLLPGPSVKYYGRKDFKSHAKMFYQYGLFKPIVNKKIGKITTLRQLAPLMLILYFLFSLLVLFFSLKIFLILIGLVFSGYFLSSFIYIISTSNNLGLIFHFIASIFLAHISYGFGYIKSLILRSVNKNLSISR